MEPAVDGGAVALEQILVIGAPRRSIAAKGTGSSFAGRIEGAPAVRKMTRLPERAVRVISCHSVDTCAGRHPILRIKQHIAIKAGARLLRQKVRKGNLLIRTRDLRDDESHRNVVPADRAAVARHRPLVAAIQRLPSEIIILRSKSHRVCATARALQLTYAAHPLAIP